MRGRAGEEPVPRMTNAVRLDRRTILPRTDKRIVGEADAEPQQLLRLPQASRPKLGNHDDAAISPRRRPHNTASTTGICTRHGLTSSSAVAVVAMSQTFISRRSILGASMSSQGFRSSIRQRTACFSA